MNGATGMPRGFAGREALCQRELVVEGRIGIHTRGLAVAMLALFVFTGDIAALYRY